MVETIVVPPRFSGPPGGANGGYVSGLLAGFLGGEAEITLRRLVPLERPLEVETSGGGLTLAASGERLAEGRPITLELDAPEPISPSEALEAAGRFPRFEEHPIPTCFVCGPDRAERDGLRVFPGPVAGREGIWAAPWIPDVSLPTEGDGLRPEIVWAALDCTGAFAVNEPPRGVALLGRLAARLDRPVAPGDETVVVGWSLGADGRKLHAGTALFDARGRRLAVARALWILT